MIRSIVRAVTLGATVAAALVGVQAASATSFVFDFTNKGSYEGAASQTYSVLNNGDKLDVKVSAWHANDPDATKLTTDSISAANLGVYSGGGMGVVFGNDTGSNGTHQIDNVGGGVDFVMLQFSKDVTLDGIARNLYSMSGAGVTCCDGTAAYWGDTNNLLGAPSATANIPLANYSLGESLFTTVPGGSGPVGFGNTGSASVWLVSAAFNQINDGFKVAGLQASTANPVAPVPEPASWALMIVGFGAVGASMRRRKAATLATA